MASNKIRMGPWTRGINLQDDPTLVSTEELTECVNFNIDTDGTLIPRSALRYQVPPVGRTWSDVFLAGTSDGLFVFVESNASTVQKIYTNNTAGGSTYTTLTPTLPANWFGTCVKANGLLYFFGNGTTTPSNSSYYINASNVLTALPNVPAASIFKAFVYKQRMWLIAAGSATSTGTVYYSKATDYTVWAAPDGGSFKLDVSDYLIREDSLVFFTENTTSVLNYTTDPTLDGTLRTISSEIGASTVAMYREEVFVCNTRGIFKFVNFQFVELSAKLDIYNNYDPSLTFYVFKAVGNYLYAFAGDSTRQRFYAYSILTGAWSTYEFKGTNSLTLTGSLFSYEPNTAYIHGLAANNSDAVGFYLQDGTTLGFYFMTSPVYTLLQSPPNHPDNQVDRVLTPTGVILAQPRYAFSTKEYIAFQLGRILLGDEDQWKRLYWWSINGRMPLAIGQPKIYIDGSLVNNPTTDTSVLGRVSSNISARFRRLKLGYEAPWAVYGGLLNDEIGPVFRSIVAHVAAKENIST